MAKRPTLERLAGKAKKAAEAPSPFRNMRKDIADALEHVQESFGFDEACFAIDLRPSMPLQKIIDHDDYSAWGEYKHGHLTKGFDEGEWMEELSSFRGAEWAERAFTWKSSQDVPAVVIVISREGTAIGDGRGRVNYAMSRGWKSLPAIILKEPGDAVCIDANRNVRWGM
jgi:hypothetical protein